MIRSEYNNLELLASKYKDQYSQAKPYPHIIIDNLFDNDYLDIINNEFTTLRNNKKKINFNNFNEKKLASSRGDSDQGLNCKEFFRFLNSSKFLDFLQVLTSIKEPLIPDPHFIGGGFHETLKGGFLKIHADFCKHPETKLDRRINLLVYLNKKWKKSFGGELELWDKEMISCGKKILPIFNRTVIFNTTDFTYHGLPDPIQCDESVSRRSLALYYYSNGRPKEELRPQFLSNKTTLFKKRPNEINRNILNFSYKAFIQDCLPPILFRVLRKFIK